MSQIPTNRSTGGEPPAEEGEGPVREGGQPGRARIAGAAGARLQRPDDVRVDGQRDGLRANPGQDHSVVSEPGKKRHGQSNDVQSTNPMPQRPRHAAAKATEEAEWKGGRSGEEGGADK